MTTKPASATRSAHEWGSRGRQIVGNWERTHRTTFARHALIDSLRDASGEQRRTVYAALDLRLTYDALGKTAAASVAPYVGSSSSAVL